MKNYFEKRRKLKETIKLLEEDIKLIERDISVLNGDLDNYNEQYLEFDRKLTNLEKYKEESEKELNVFYGSLMLLFLSLGIVILAYSMKFSLMSLGKILLILGPINIFTLVGREIKIIFIKRKYQKLREKNGQVIKQLKREKDRAFDKMRILNDKIGILVNRKVKDKGLIRDAEDNIVVLDRIIVDQYEMTMEKRMQESSKDRENREMVRKLIL